MHDHDGNRGKRGGNGENESGSGDDTEVLKVVVEACVHRYNICIFIYI
jgi:hypothetical protein